MTTHPKGKRARKRRKLPFILGGTAIVVVAALIATYVLVRDESPPVAQGTETPTPSITPTPTPTPEPIPDYFAAATFDGWAIADNGDLGTTFTVSGDSVTDGFAALRIDSSSAPASSYSNLIQSVPATPGTQYTVTAWTASPDMSVSAVAPALFLGDDLQKFDFPSKSTTPAESSWTYTTGETQTSIPIALSSQGPIAGFVLDQLSISADGGTTNLVSNNSFEAYSSPNFIAGPSLVLTSATSTINVNWFTRSIDWSVYAQDGTEVSSGSQLTAGGVGALPLGELPQGYYNLEVNAVGVASPPITTSFMVLTAHGTDELTSDDRFGVAGHIHETFNAGSESVAAQIGIKGVRTDARWTVVEQEKGVYNFPQEYATPFDAFKNAGITLLPLSNGKNKFYDRGRLPHSPEGIQAYADYTAAMVDHYDATAVEVHNELNQVRFNDGNCGITADCYMPLLTATYNAVKAVSPSTLIVGPANANQDDPYLTELYRLGGLNYLDVVSYHPYPAQPEALEADIIQAVNRIKEFNNGVAKPIWLTEFGWTASTSGAVSEQTQANYLIRSETIAFANGVEKAYWYDLVNDETDPANHEGNFGLFRQVSESVRAFEPKPAAMAQAVLIRKIAGKEFVSNESLDASVHAYLYGSGDSGTRILWSTSPATVQFASDVALTVTAGSGTVRTEEPVAGVVTLTLSEEPIFVDGTVSPAVIAPAN